MTGTFKYGLMTAVVVIVFLYIAAPDVDSRIYRSERGSAADDNPVQGPFSSEPVHVEHLNPDVPTPWDLEFLPDGNMLLTSRNGGVFHFDGRVTKQIATLSPHVYGHTGLMGMAVDPQFENNAWVYLLYTYEALDDEAVSNRIERYVLAHDQLVFDQVLLDRLPGSLEHAGGGLEFGADGALYATVGDADQPGRAADASFLGGKILRMNRDGEAPEDNPFPNSFVFTSGHRNPQGLAWQPDTGTAFSAEHGAFRHDEVNRLSAGANYGWDRMSCHKRRVSGLGRVLFRFALWLPDSLTSDDSEPPVYCPETWNMAPSQMAFVNTPEHPWFGDLFLGSLVARHVRRFELDTQGNVQSSEIFFPRQDVASGPRVRDVEYHDGSIYVLTNPQGLIRISPSP